MAPSPQLPPAILGTTRTIISQLSNKNDSAKSEDPSDYSFDENSTNSFNPILSSPNPAASVTSTTPISRKLKDFDVLPQNFSSKPLYRLPPISNKFFLIQQPHSTLETISKTTVAMSASSKFTDLREQFDSDLRDQNTALNLDVEKNNIQQDQKMEHIHRRVASARTSREQATAQAKKYTRKNAAIAAVKKTLNYSVAEMEMQEISATAEPVFDEKETRRIKAIHSMRILSGPRESRFDAITALTSRLLAAEICTISIVDSKKVWFWSIHCSNNSSAFFSSSQCSRLLHEPRCDSFCQYTIREDEKFNGGATSGGFVVLDASKEPKFKTRQLVKSGFCFYAGAPLVTKAGVKVGALSIRGPARSNFTSQEAKILRQMTEWAIGELELYIAKRELDFRESTRLAISRIRELCQDSLEIVEQTSGGGRNVLKQCIEITKMALKLKNAIILKLKRLPEGKVKSIVFAVADSKCDVKSGEEKFTELCEQTLENRTSSPFILDKSTASHLQICRYIGERVCQSASELIWSHGRPVAVIALFFEGAYKTVGSIEEQFVIDATVLISKAWQCLETQDSLRKILNPDIPAQQIVLKLKKLFTNFKTAKSSALSLVSGPPIIQQNKPDSRKSESTLYTRSSKISLFASPPQVSLPLKVYVLICEPVLPASEGNIISQRCHKSIKAIPTHPRSDSNIQISRSPSISSTFVAAIRRSFTSTSIESTASSKNQTGARKSRSSSRNDSAGKFELNNSSCTERIWGGTKNSNMRKIFTRKDMYLTPRGAIDLIADFTQMFEVVCAQHSVSGGKKYGNIFVATGGVFGDNEASDLLNVAKDLSQTLAEYSRETGINVTARIGIHGATIPASITISLATAESMWISLANFAYQLEHTHPVVAISEFVYESLDDSGIFGVYKPCGSMFIPGVGVMKAFTLCNITPSNSVQINCKASSVNEDFNFDTADEKSKKEQWNQRKFKR
ncbi:hypothetical protein HK100_005235, partial [Physocladia obscura]